MIQRLPAASSLFFLDSQLFDNHTASQMMRMIPPDRIPIIIMIPHHTHWPVLVPSNILGVTLTVFSQPHFGHEKSILFMSIMF